VPRHYPAVIGEFDTIRKLLKGFSIARFGDGEVKLMDKHVYTRELQPVPALAHELKTIARKPHKNCLIGIWTLNPDGPKYASLVRMKDRFAKYFNTSTGLTYYSSFITRPDTGAWLETREYYEQVIQIWNTKQRIVVVSETDSKLLEYVRLTQATPPLHVACPTYSGFSQIDRMQAEVLAHAPDIVLISCGVTATALAHRLTVKGLQAIDLGSIGGFLLRWRLQTPRPENYALERANNAEALKHGPDDHTDGAQVVL